MTRKILLVVVSIALAGFVFYVAKAAWYERYVWPAVPEHMLDLPPEDRTGWPSEPIPWLTETQRVEIATPEGLSTRTITYRVNSLGMDFVLIEPGSYFPEPSYRSYYSKRSLRRAKHLREEKPAPRITLTSSYCIGAFEVTNAQYELFKPNHRKERPEYQQDEKGDHHPVEPVSWREAQLFARWLSAKEGRRYRLPTEAEWEYAEKAGTATRFYWGNAFWDRSMANLGGLHSVAESYREDGYKATAPVGMYPANPWGLYDTLGNSYEWVADWWHPDRTEDEVDPTGPAEGRIRMAKGGSWTTRTYAMFSSENDGNNPADIRDIRGFRLLAECDG